MKDFQELKTSFDLEELPGAKYRFICDNLIEDIIPFIKACAILIAKEEQIEQTIEN